LEDKHTPLELIDTAYQSLTEASAKDLLSQLRACSPAFFEAVVVKLLMAMGHAGVASHGTVTGKAGDGGINGVIKQDKLGLDVVCIRAKRWDGPVGRPVLKGFVGTMDHARAKKGVIMTTSGFTKDALDYVERIEGKKVVPPHDDPSGENHLRCARRYECRRTSILPPAYNSCIFRTEIAGTTTEGRCDSHCRRITPFERCCTWQPGRGGRLWRT